MIHREKFTSFLIGQRIQTQEHEGLGSVCMSYTCNRVCQKPPDRPFATTSPTYNVSMFLIMNNVRSNNSSCLNLTGSGPSKDLLSFNISPRCRIFYVTNRICFGTASLPVPTQVRETFLDGVLIP